MTQKIFIFLAFLGTIFAQAQTPDLSLFKNMKPRNIGPAGMSGRVTSIDVVEDDPDVMYVGTASGGLWKSESGGIDWMPIFDDQVTASIGAVAIQQSNPSVIWVGTGEGNPRNSLNGGYGIYKSLDGGRSWQSMGLEKTRHIHRVVIHPENPDIVYAAAIGSPWGEHPERGVYRTEDGGKTWEKILFQNNKTGAADLIIDPTNPNKLFAAMWEHKREPWFFTSGGEGSGLFMTHDGGDTWKELTDEDGLPEGELGRIGVAIAPSDPDIVYALIESKKNALYKSTDGGFTWNMINAGDDIGNRPFYYSEIYVDPQNENRLYSIFTYVNVSEDGGKSFRQLMPAYGSDSGVHPDHHAWYIHPENGKFLIDGNDGGLNISRDRGESWRFIGNLPVAQFYHIAVDNDIPYNVYGGMQDNGSWKGPAYVWRAQGIRNSYWQEISFGDGFDVSPDPDNPRYGFSMSQQGYVSRYDAETGNNYPVRPIHPDPEMQLRFNWNAAIARDPFDPNTIYFGSQFVHKSTDLGQTWNVISPDLTTNDPEKQKQQESGGLTIDATGAENYTTLLVIEPSPVEKGVLWTGSDDGIVSLSRNGGESWTQVQENIPELPKGSWIVQIKASKTKKGHALLVANDYRRFNYKPYAYRTTNYGKSWERIVEEGDTESYALSIIEDPEENNLMFLGTDDGLYISFDAGKNWQKYTHGFPTVSVKDLVIHPREHDLVIGTFGRAAWVLDDIRPMRHYAKTKGTGFSVSSSSRQPIPSPSQREGSRNSPVSSSGSAASGGVSRTSSASNSSSLVLFDPPTAYHARYQQPTGSRFGADAMYNGENRGSAARFKYYYDAAAFASAKKQDQEGSEDQNESASEPTETTAQSKDSLYLRIYDGERLIRTLSRKRPDSTRIYEWNWYLNEKGTYRPTRSVNEEKYEPSGIDVLPGKYRAVLSCDNHESMAMIIVEEDPRVEGLSMADLRAKREALKDMEQLTEMVYEQTQRLARSKKSAERFKSVLKEADKEKYEEQLKATDSIIKGIEELQELYFGKVDKRQGITRSREPDVMSRIYNARGYIASRQGPQTATESTLTQQAKDDAMEAIEQTQRWFAKEWQAYRDEMEKVEVDFFQAD